MQHVAVIIARKCWDCITMGWSRLLLVKLKRRTKTTTTNKQQQQQQQQQGFPVMAGSHSCRWSCPHGWHFEDHWQHLWRRRAIIPEAGPWERFMYVHHGTALSVHQVPQRWKWQSLDIMVVVGPTWTSSIFWWDSSDHPERDTGFYAWHPYAMIPWCFSYDRLNYARYLPYYYAQMFQQPTPHPDMHAEFMQGGFSAQFGSTNPFGRIHVDQMIK